MPYKGLLLLLLFGRALRGESGRLVFNEVESQLKELIKSSIRGPAARLSTRGCRSH